jgi:hypothetical protein
MVQAAGERKCRLMLPARAPKKQKRATRWKSQAHRTFVCREFVCAFCGSRAPRESLLTFASGPTRAWVRSPTTGVRASLRRSAGCHATQHRVGERTFWADYEKRHGQSVEQLIESLIKVSPRRAEIEAVRRERGL